MEHIVRDEFFYALCQHFPAWSILAGLVVLHDRIYCLLVLGCRDAIQEHGLELFEQGVVCKVVQSPNQEGYFGGIEISIHC